MANSARTTMERRCIRWDLGLGLRRMGSYNERTVSESHDLHAQGGIVENVRFFPLIAMP